MNSLKQKSSPRPMIHVDRIEQAVAANEIIEAVEPWDRDPNQMTIRAGGRIVARILASDAEAHDLSAGGVLNKSVAEIISACVLRDSARRTALALLARRDFSREELQQRLTQRGFDADTSNAILKELERDHWIDEHRYAQTIIEHALARGHVTRPALKAALERRMVRNDISERILDSALAGIEMYPAALKLARARLEQIATASPASQARRIAGLLHRKGFDDQTIGDVILELGLASDEQSEI